MPACNAAIIFSFDCLNATYASQNDWCTGPVVEVAADGPLLPQADSTAAQAATSSTGRWALSTVERRVVGLLGPHRKPARSGSSLLGYARSASSTDAMVRFGTTGAVS